MKKNSQRKNLSIIAATSCHSSFMRSPLSCSRIYRTISPTSLERELWVSSKVLFVGSASVTSSADLPCTLVNRGWGSLSNKLFLEFARLAVRLCNRLGMRKWLGIPSRKAPPRLSKIGGMLWRLLAAALTRRRFKCGWRSPDKLDSEFLKWLCEDDCSREMLGIFLWTVVSGSMLSFSSVWGNFGWEGSFASIPWRIFFTGTLVRRAIQPRTTWRTQFGTGVWEGLLK